MANTNTQVITQTEESTSAPLTAASIRAQVNLIQGVMKEVMQDGQHYGLIPGCGKKPSLLKPGAEKLSLTFRLRPVMGDGDIDVLDMGNGHREYRIRCHILNYGGVEMATGVGSASTMESKFRYRNVADYELTDQPIPKDAKEKKIEYRKQGFGMKLVDGVWAWVKYGDSEKTETPDIADVYNTVLKMGKKRAYVDGILSATAASDIFTQDLEDIVENGGTTQAKPAQSEPARPQIPQRKSVQEDEAANEALKALAAKKSAEFHQSETANNPHEMAPPAPKAPPAKAQTPPNDDKPLTATGFIEKVHPANAGGYKTYELHGVKGPNGWNKLFATKDLTVIETLEARVATGNEVCLEYTESPWTKGNRSGMNYSITGVAATPEVPY